MEIVIVGAGSIGLLLGSFMAEAGMPITYVVRRKEQADTLRMKGLQRINEDGSSSTFQVNAVTDNRSTPTNAIWIIAVKYAGLSTILNDIQNAKLEVPVLFIQNGIGHVKMVDSTSLTDIAFATVEHGARRLDDYTVIHNGVGKITIATARGNDQLFHSLADAHSDLFPIDFNSDVEQMLMRKVLVNCMINPLTAILQVKNGALVSNPQCVLLLEQLYCELITVFSEMKSILPYRALVDICQKTAENHSSMLSDRKAGRPMEIETIVTAVIHKAEERQHPLPLLTTLEKMLYAVDEIGGVE